MIYSKQSYKGVYSILYGIIDNLISHFSKLATPKKRVKLPQECEECHQDSITLPVQHLMNFNLQQAFPLVSTKQCLWVSNA